MPFSLVDSGKYTFYFFTNYQFLFVNIQEKKNDIEIIDFFKIIF